MRTRNKNRFFIIYSDDAYSFPIEYFETLDELAAFFKKSTDAMRSLIHKHKKYYKGDGIKAPNNIRYVVREWDDTKGLIKEV